MNDQQKIELGAEIWNKCASFMSLEEGDPDEMSAYFKETCIKIAEFALNRISEITKKDIADGLEEIGNSGRHSEAFNNIPDPTTEHLTCTCHNQFGPTTDDAGYVCGVCYALKCNECINNDFEICPICTHAGKSKITCKDKNGAIFQSGDTLRNEHSLTTTIKILQLHKTHFLTEPGGVIEIQDFIDAGWIVHDRVTPYSVDCGWFYTECKFKNHHIGETGCMSCPENKGANQKQNWIICELYNKEERSK